MKRMRIIIISLVSIILLCTAGFDGMVCAQEYVPAKVEKSREKVKIRGKIFYAHKVIAKQTLYSISKVYEVSIEDIENANPKLAADGLKEGTIIYIPADSKPEKQARPAKSSRPAKDAAKKKKNEQTKKNDVSKRIKSAFGSGSSEEDMTSEAVAEAVADDTAHGDDVSVTESGISGMHMLPYQGDMSDTAGLYDDGIYTISFVMPFNADTTTDDLSMWSSDFYSGALIAVDSLKKAGKFGHFRLNVIDLTKYRDAWHLAFSGDLAGSELIIGPIAERGLTAVAEYAKQNKIPVVSAFDLKTAPLAHNNPYFFLFPPQTSMAMKHQIEKMAAPIVTDTTESITVIYEKGYENSDYVRSAFAELDSAGLAYNTFSYDFLSGRGIDSLMSLSLDPERLNKVLIPSMAASFINDAMRNLNLIKSSYGYDITVYGLSQWKSMETLENEYFHALDLRLVLSYYNDYNDPGTKEFIRKYTEVFNYYPNSFSFQGYDIMMYFVEAMYEYGKSFPAQLIGKRKSLLQSDVLFLPIEPGCGYWNIAFKDVCYMKGWNVVLE